MTLKCDQLAQVEQIVRSFSGTGHSQQMQFLEVGATGDKWLAFLHPSTSSNLTPGLVFVKSILEGFVFINEDHGATCYIQIFKNGTDPGDMIYEYHFDNPTVVGDGAWGVCKSDLNLPCDPCDRVSVYIKKDTPSRVKEPRLWLFFSRTADAVTGESVFV